MTIQKCSVCTQKKMSNISKEKVKYTNIINVGNIACLIFQNSSDYKSDQT